MTAKDDKSHDAFRTIGEAAKLVGEPAHVLRTWETKFPQVKPLKRTGGRRYYRPGDIDLLKGLSRLLSAEGLTVKGVRKILADRGVSHVMAIGAGVIDAATLSDVSASVAPAAPSAAALQGSLVRLERVQARLELALAEARNPRCGSGRPGVEEPSAGSGGHRSVAQPG